MTVEEYIQALSEVLKKRADWLEKNELPKLKDGLRAYHTGFACLYNLYLKKGLINEDPYKQEAKISELEVPDARPFPEGKRIEELTLRLANYDNQLDFLVNFYQFSVDFLTLDRIRRIVGLIKYIDWVNLSMDSQSSVTKAVADMTNQIKTGTDQLTMSVITESLSNLNKSFVPIMTHLKLLTDYHRELYKLEIRESATSKLSQSEASQLPAIKRKFAHANQGRPFYPDLAEEVIREDNTEDGAKIREKILKNLEVAEEKAKVVKAPVSFKKILLEGIIITGSTAPAFSDIISKIDDNKALLESEKHGFWHALLKLIRMMLGKATSQVVYDLEYIDQVKGTPVRERIVYSVFRGDLDRRLKTLSVINNRGPGMAKLEAMQDEQLITFLERNVRDIQAYHKTLSAMDEYFKSSVARHDRDKIRGIKPELTSIKNATIRANAKRHEYSAQKEEEEQLKRLGVIPAE